MFLLLALLLVAMAYGENPCKHFNLASFASEPQDLLEGDFLDRPYLLLIFFDPEEECNQDTAFLVSR